MTDRELLELLVEKVSNIEERTKENTDMIKALRHASEVQSAKIEGMEMELTNLSGHVAKSNEDLTEVKDAVNRIENKQTILVDMYGEHEVELRALKEGKAV